MARPSGASQDDQGSSKTENPSAHAVVVESKSVGPDPSHRAPMAGGGRWTRAGFLDRFWKCPPRSGNFSSCF